jgi:7-cyano-7-deazaguanine synthase in queuosine biosynthesis
MAGINDILLFSAGMDSMILKTVYQFPNNQCLFVRMGTEENRIEERVIDKFYPGVFKIDFPLSPFELGNKIIPFRNHHLALLAAHYGTNIFFAFTAGDTTKDKDYVFKSQMEGILNYFSIDQQKVHFPGPYSIQMPFKEQTKTELVAMYLKAGGKPIDLLVRSNSCYAGLGSACGECRSCLRKYVALRLNGIDTGFFLEDPKNHLTDFLSESLAKNRKKEVEEIERCLKLS